MPYTKVARFLEKKGFMSWIRAVHWVEPQSESQPAQHIYLRCACEPRRGADNHAENWGKNLPPS